MIPMRYHPPRPLEVVAAPDGTPRAFGWRRHWRQVARVERAWRREYVWWQGAGAAIRRAYDELTTRDGLRCVIYRALIAEGWYLEQILD